MWVRDGGGDGGGGGGALTRGSSVLSVGDRAQRIVDYKFCRHEFHHVVGQRLGL